MMEAAFICSSFTRKVLQAEFNCIRRCLLMLCSKFVILHIHTFLFCFGVDGRKGVCSVSEGMEGMEGWIEQPKKTE